MKNYNKSKIQIDCITAHGNIINYDEPEHTKIDLLEIYQHIKNICRYNGAIDVKLIHHLALVVQLAKYDHVPTFTGRPPLLIDHTLNKTIQAGYAATHDMPEVYVGDIVSGLKRKLQAFQDIEAAFDEHVHEQLGLPIEFRNDPYIKQLDLHALCIEMAIHDHPATSYVWKKHKIIPTTPMTNLAQQIMKTPYTDLWEIIHTAIQHARVELAKIDSEETKNE